MKKKSRNRQNRTQIHYDLLEKKFEIHVLGHEEIVKILLQEGANPRIRDVEGNTARDIGVKKGVALQYRI